jgi:hypothetical protein
MSEESQAEGVPENYREIGFLGICSFICGILANIPMLLLLIKPLRGITGIVDPYAKSFLQGSSAMFFMALAGFFGFVGTILWFLEWIYSIIKKEPIVSTFSRLFVLLLNIAPYVCLLLLFKKVQIFKEIGL